MSDEQFNSKIMKIISDKLVQNISHLPFSIQNLQGLLNPPPRLSSRLSSRLKLFALKPPLLSSLHLSLCDLHKDDIA